MPRSNCRSTIEDRRHFLPGWAASATSGYPSERGCCVGGHLHGTEPLTNELVEAATSAFLVDEIHPGQLLVIAFAHVDWGGIARFDFFRRLRRLEARAGRPINLILVRDARNAWYHRGIPGLGDDVDQVAAALANIVRAIGPSRVVTLGQSMAGYAAIMFGTLLGADAAVAFGPLSFLSAQEALLYHELRWLPVFQQLEADPPPVRYFDLPALCRERGGRTRLDIIFGTKPDAGGTESVNLDAMHAHQFSGLPHCVLHPFPEAGHTVVKYLIDRGLIDDLLLRHVFDAPDAG